MAKKEEKLTLEQYKEYKERQEKKAKGIKIPVAVKIILLIPAIIICIFGLLFIPWVVINMFFVK